MAVLWNIIRQRLDKFGSDRRGVIKLPELTDSALLTLSSLLDKKLTTRIDLAALEVSLCNKGVGANLSQALEQLGFPASASHIASRAASQRRAAARSAVEKMIAHWPEPWCEEWAEWLFRSGLMANIGATAASQLAQDARKVLDTTDQVSTPVLTWGLQLHTATALGQVCHAANQALIPLHLSGLALQHNEIRRDVSQQSVLLVENPRLVEAAAERKIAHAVVATNGNPSNVVIILVQALLKQNVEIRYHGDFDAAGIAICKRMFEMGCTPWLMQASDYQRALAKAQQLSIELPVDDADCGETPWDEELQQQMIRSRVVVHEELLIEEILNGLFAPE